MKRILSMVFVCLFLSSCGGDDDDDLESGTCEALADKVWECDSYPEKFYDKITRGEYEQSCIEDKESDKMLQCFLDCDTSLDCDRFNKCFMTCTDPSKDSYI